MPQGLRVATVYKRTPAREAGIQPGEVITGVNGHSIAGKDADAVTSEIRGPAGTKVTLTIASRDGDTRDVTLTRREVEIPQVIGHIEKVGDTKVGYVRLAGFFPGAHGELRKEVEHLYAQGAQGLILDLRGNGGGLLTEAVLVSSIFVPDGVIVSTHGRTQNTRTFDATGDSLPSHPMVVLINGDTASASEIVTAALEQAGIAKVVGTTSFGKGTFQEVIPLKNGGALDLTVGQYLTRNGTSINDVGIPPQVKAKDNPSTKPDEGLQQGAPDVGSAALKRVVLVSKRGRFLVGELLFERGGRIELGGGRRAATPGRMALVELGQGRGRARVVRELGDPAGRRT